MSNRTGKRRILLDLAVTLDGFIEGKNGETDWCIMDAEMSFKDFLDSIDTIFYGRKSYELWGEYTPEVFESSEEKEIWELIHQKNKVVFSKSLTDLAHNVTVINKNILETVMSNKDKPGKDIWLYGGASLITTFVNLGLIDEYRLSVHPVVLGEGKPMFIDIKQRLELQLIHTKAFSSGVVQLIYQPKSNI